MEPTLLPLRAQRETTLVVVEDFICHLIKRRMFSSELPAEPLTNKRTYIIINIKCELRTLSVVV